MRDPKVIGDIDSGEKQCIVSLDRIGGGWFANPLVGFQQAFDMKREGLPRSCNHMVDRRRSYRARGEIRKRRRVSDVDVSFHDRDKGRHLQLAAWQKGVAAMDHFVKPDPPQLRQRSTLFFLPQGLVSHGGAEFRAVPQYVSRVKNPNESSIP
jgi:hypothetical protein